MDKQILTAKEAQKYLGVGRHIFEKFVNNGKISFILTIGKQKRFPRKHLDQFIDEQSNKIKE